MKRGDIYTAATGHGYGSKPRPVLILQNDLYCDAPRIVTAMFATPRSTLVWPRMLIEPSDQNGLKHASELQLDILTTISVSKFDQHVGQLGLESLRAADNALLTLLGFNQQ